MVDIEAPTVLDGLVVENTSGVSYERATLSNEKSYSPRLLFRSPSLPSSFVSLVVLHAG